MILSPSQLNSLLTYTYTGSPHGFLVKKYAQCVWNPLLNLIPLHINPCIFSIMGFVPLVVWFGLVLYYAPHLTEEGPCSFYVGMAVCLFVYQTFSAIDGQHGKETRSFSPVAHLLDQGCESAGVFICVLSVVVAFRLGSSFRSMALLTTTQWTFLLAKSQSLRYNKGYCNIVLLIYQMSGSI